MLGWKSTSRLLATAFIVGSLIMGICAYLSFSPQSEGLGYGVMHFKINGYTLLVPVQSSVLSWVDLSVSIVFLIVGIQLLALHLTLPKDLKHDYEQYLYPSSTDEKNQNDSL